MKKILIFWFLFCFIAASAFAGTEIAVPGLGPLQAPSETLIWMFFTLMILKIVSSGLFFVETWLMIEDRHPLWRGLGYVVKSLRFSLDQVIANSRAKK